MFNIFDIDYNQPYKKHVAAVTKNNLTSKISEEIESKIGPT